LVSHTQPAIVCLLIFQLYVPVLRIRIHLIHMFLGLPDPDLLIRCMDPDPSIFMQK
jgi:hypothetical protein